MKNASKLSKIWTEFAKKWKSKDYSIKYDEIIDILEEYNIHITQNEQHMYRLYYLLQKNYSHKTLCDELSKAWNGNDNNLIIYNILFKEFNVGSNERQQIYDILLHKYFKVEDLNMDNMIHVSQTLIKQLELDGIIDIETFSSIVRDEKLDGAKLMDGSAITFAALFKSMNVTRTQFAKLFRQFKANWKPKDYHQMEAEKHHEEEVLKQDIELIEETKYEEKTKVEQDGKIPHCIDVERVDERDPLPIYLYKTIFYRSEDETLEVLIDDAVLAVLKCGLWDKPHFIDKVYNDYNYDPNDNNYEQKTYCGAVIELYEEIRGNTYLNDFVAKYAQREMQIWKIENENIEPLTSEELIFIALQSVKFESLDKDASADIDIHEFLGYFKEHKIQIDEERLKLEFSDIDKDNNGKITSEEYNEWKHHKKFERESLEQVQSDAAIYYIKEQEQHGYHMIKDKDIKEPHQMEKITRIKSKTTQNTTFKWAVYVPKLRTAKQRKRFSDLQIKVNGYWQIMTGNDRDKKPGCIKYEELDEQHLNIIFQLLNHYYVKKIDVATHTPHYHQDTSPLRRRIGKQGDEKEEYDLDTKEDDVERKEEEYDIPKKFKDKEVMIHIDGNDYALVWWNEKGRREPNAITIINHTAHEQRVKMYREKQLKLKQPPNNPPKPKEISYIRFDSDVETLQWLWYDNDNIEYKPLGEYPNVGDDDEKHSDDDEKYSENKHIDHNKIHKPLIESLEVNFLANLKDNFDPDVFSEQFNHALLPELTWFMREKIKKGAGNAYIFEATFNLDKMIINMEQKSVTDDGTQYERNIKRMVDDRDSLLTSGRDNEFFIAQWKQSYNLYTLQQQQFFWCCILAICAKMKYIDIEFSHQIVCLPLNSKDKTTKQVKDKALMQLIDDRDVSKDMDISIHNKGCIIPPTNLSIVDHKKVPICKTDILQEAERSDYNLDLIDSRWIQRLTEPTKIQHDSDSLHLFTEDEAIFLRFMECIRKYVLEFDLGDTLRTLWPWYRNTLHCKDYPCEDSTKYNKLLIKYDLSQRFAVKDMRSALRENWKVGSWCKIHLNSENDVSLKDKWHDGQIINIMQDKSGVWLKIKYKHKENDKVYTTIERNSNQLSHHQLMDEKPPIRHRRKHAAMQLLSASQTQRNLNIIKHQLQLCLDTMAQEATKNLWKTAIQNANTAFQIKFKKKDKYELFAERLENIKSVDIAKWKLPLFEAFVWELFVESDKVLYNKLHQFGGVKEYFYRNWLDDWRNVPDWYRYDHDVLLLELVIRNGLNIDDIINDLSGEKKVEYKLRINQYYEFKTWCKHRINILHRLKYVTKTIVDNLQNDDYKPSLIDIRCTEKNDEALQSQIFSNYQYETHKMFIQQKDEPKVRLGVQLTRIASIPQLMHHDTMVIDRSDKVCINDEYSDAEDEDELEDLQSKVQKLHVPMVFDPYLSRNIDDELYDALQSFDLMKYGKPLALFIVHQLKQENKRAYWKVLGQLLEMLPYPLAKETLNSVKDFLQYAPTDTLRELCTHIVKGTQFKPSAALGMAEFFEDLAEQDMIQAKEWMKIASHFETKATEAMHKIESNHLLFVALTVPIKAQEGKSLLHLALEQERMFFLNSERIANVSQHQFRTGVLKPSDIEPDTKPLTSKQLLHTIVSEPFKFYLSAQGYSWIGCVLLMLYLGYLYFYAYYRPLSGALVDTSSRTMEVILWTCNIGYIVYEILELYQKDFAGYFNLGVGGQINVMDAVICLIWIALLGMRVKFIGDYYQNEMSYQQDEEPTALQNSYVFLFGLQIALITMRSLSQFSTSEYLGPLLKTIKLMCIEIYKFMFIYIIIMVGIMFGLWYIVLTHNQFEEFDPDNIWLSFLYVFEVFIGSADLGPITEQSIAVVFMIFATFLGTLLLTNLLIALMATEYEHVRERAQQEVLFNQIELTFDLSKRSRLMPPPLNIIVIMLCVIIWIINFVVSSIKTSCNIFANLNYNLFETLRAKEYKCGCPVWIISTLWLLFIIGICITENNKDFWFIFSATIGILYLVVMCCIVLDLFNIFEACCSRSKRNKTENKTQYFRSFSGWEFFRWNCCCLCRYECCYKFRCCGRCKEDVKWMRNVHHKGCYAELILHSQDVNKYLNPVKGITIAQYIDEYERVHNEINSDDKSVLKMLTTDILFCEQCYRPFENEESKISEQLAVPLQPLFDFCSVVTFVLIPIAWLPLVLIFGLLAFKDRIGKWFHDRNHAKQKHSYTNQNFDAEYFPKRT